MLRFTTAAVAALLVGSFAMAADNENAEKATTDTSKNPITGKVTTTKKYNKKMKDAAGNEMNMKVKEKTAVKKDGTVEKSVDASGDTTDKNGKH